MTKQRTRKRYKASPSSARGKGDILEAAVASLHEGPGLTVERNVFLPSLDGSGRTREVDVLVTATVAGYPIRVAIECKNETKPVGAQRIDAFVGKLDDVGVPRQHGVFVTPTRYTSGALKRAKSAGIETLLFKDISAELPKAVGSAFQSIVYLLLAISNIAIRNDQPGPALAGEMLFFRNAQGSVVGGVPDLVWQMWRRGQIPDTLGSHRFQIALPDGWLQVINGTIAKVEEINIEVAISAHTVTFPGSLTGSALVRPDSTQATKMTLQATFPKPVGTFPVVSFSREADLEDWLSARRGLGVAIGRIRLPRIRWTSLYWPPSDKAMAALAQIFLRSVQHGQDFNIDSIPLEEIEGSDLSAVWDPIMKSHPSQAEGDLPKPDPTTPSDEPSNAAA